MEKNYFELATRNKYRFDTERGSVSTEDLWDLPLKSKTGMDLDTVAKTLNKKIKAEDEESFVDTKSNKTTELTDRLELVKYIISVKIAEEDKRKKATENAAKRKKLLEVLATKQEEGIQAMTEEDILAELKALEEGE